jgi:hypothetical protein
MQNTLTLKQGWFSRWVKQLAFALLPVFARMLLVITSAGRSFTPTEVHHRWAATGALTSLAVLGLCTLFIHAFRDRLRFPEVVALLLAAVLASAFWTGYLVAIDPATLGIIMVSAPWQWCLLILAIASSLVFLLVLGYFVDAKPKPLRSVSPTA